MSDSNTSPASVQSNLYRAIWRWHFYAGLIVMPFLVLLAVTGGLYLFKPEIEHAIYRSMIDVASRAEQAPLAAVQASAERALDGEVLQLILPRESTRSVQLLVRVPTGDVRTAYVDPHDARFLGSTPYGGIMQTVRKIHSLQLFGFWASSLIEAAAGWAIIMVLTGIFLWWPRGAKGGVVTVRATPKKRVFWRDFHAVTGAFAAIFILFLAVTGMPWSMFWGDRVQAWVSTENLGRPNPPIAQTPAFLLGVSRPPDTHAEHDHTLHEAVTDQLPWAVQQATPPHSMAGTPISIDTAVANFESLGVQRPFAVQSPEGAHGAYTATYAPDQVERTRIVYLDQITGAVLDDISYPDFGPAARAIEWGIAVHQGQQYGPINRYLMLAACIAIVLLAISAVTMWWKRRPKGALAAPPKPERASATWTALALIAIVGAIYPLTGATILIALGVDGILQRMRQR